MYCSKCGAKVEDNAKFCEACGKRIFNEEEIEAILLKEAKDKVETESNLNTKEKNTEATDLGLFNIPLGDKKWFKEHGAHHHHHHHHSSSDKSKSSNSSANDSKSSHSSSSNKKG